MKIDFIFLFWVNWLELKTCDTAHEFDKGYQFGSSHEYTFRKNNINPGRCAGPMSVASLATDSKMVNVCLKIMKKAGQSWKILKNKFSDMNVPNNDALMCNVICYGV